VPLTSYLRAARALLRVPTYLLLLVYYGLAYLSAGRPAPETTVTLLAGAGVIALWYINATSINDLSDFEIDQVNLQADQARPLVTGALDRAGLRRIAIGSAVGALGLAWVVGGPAVLLVAIMLVLNLAYSLPPARISHRGGLALALLPVGYVGLTMGLGWLVAGAASLPGTLALTVICYVQFLARISLKDYRDVEGDARFGKRTFLLRHGQAAVVRLALVAHAAAGVSGVIWLYLVSPYGAAAYAFLATIALTCLQRLGQAGRWPLQRIWIAAYGRLVSGQLAVLLVAQLVRAGLLDSGAKEISVLLVLIGGFAWSTRQVVVTLQRLTNRKK
jgi:4-hydroxybenzoate polyprenyltransferase